MKNDGGAAYPQTCLDALDVGMVHEGMTLRDYMAGQALVGLVDANIIADTGKERISDLYSALSIHAYAIADAMIKARGD